MEGMYVSSRYQDFLLTQYPGRQYLRGFVREGSPFTVGEDLEDKRET